MAVPVLLFTAQCKKKKDALPFLLFGAQEATNPVDVNGNPLPNNEENGQQEVATSGPALITGSVVALEGDQVDGDFDYSSVKVQLVDPDGNVVAGGNLNANGDYSFSIDNLENNNYRVVIPEGQGLEGSHVDFNFVFDPTSSPTEKQLADIRAQVTTFITGPAIIHGSVESPGYDDGSVTVGPGPLAGVEVVLMNQNQDVIATTTTNNQGDFTFDLQDSNEWLSNGSYVIVARGSDVSSQGRSYTDVATGVDFVFQGNIQSNTTSVDAGKISSAWDAAQSASADITGKVSNVALSGVDMSGLTVELLDANGQVLDSDSTDSDGNYSLDKTLNNGVYSVRISGGSYQSVSKSFGFTARADGSTTAMDMGTIGIRPGDSLISGNITDQGTGSQVDGAVISFRPAQDQPIEKLSYLLDDPDLGAAIQRWIQEKQSTGSYQTYLTKSYEEAGDHLELTAVPGKWRFYVSAAGFSPSSDPQSGDNASNVITVNGATVQRSVALSSNTSRARIQGTAVVLDTLLNGSKNAYPGGAPGYTARGNGLPGMLAVLLNNQNQSGQPVAHIALTGADGSFSFGKTHVVLSGSSGSDAERVAEAVILYTSGQATTEGLGSGSWSGDALYSDSTGE
ncbi:MAG: carboxypeptidase regulatory-like domain-containing protein, partial [Leptospiraceae bacterium]|nr:carboxypeptidase regulatory-like domain-containing protein [Leptospiraceae bacterium]